MSYAFTTAKEKDIQKRWYEPRRSCVGFKKCTAKSYSKSEYNRRYYAQNAQRLKKEAMVQYMGNPAQKMAATRALYKANPTPKKTAARTQYQANPSEKKAQARALYQANPDIKKAQARALYQANPDIKRPKLEPFIRLSLMLRGLELGLYLIFAIPKIILLELKHFANTMLITNKPYV